MPEVTLTIPSPLINLMVSQELAGSLSEAKRLVMEQAVRVNGQLVKDWDIWIGTCPNSDCVLQVGRRKFIRVVC